MTSKQLAILEAIHKSGHVADVDALYAAIAIIEQLREVVDRLNERREELNEQISIACDSCQSWKNIAEQRQATVKRLQTEVAELREQLEGTRCYLCKVPHPNHAERCPDR